MSHALERCWQNDHSEEVDSGALITERVVGTAAAASGLDLVAGLAVRLQQNQTDTAGRYLLQSVALPEMNLRPQNRRALALLQAWLVEPDDLGDDWWDAFEQDLKQYRFSLHKAE